MTRRITCYVVFVTLIWGAHTQNEEKIRDNKFKSNMTRTDFSNLLSSLIKLNEQRVSVLQRLYKLEDYGVLSEVLRTGDRKPESGNGNPNNLFLIVMSKNETNPSRRNGGFEVVDTVTSLDVGSKKKDYPKLNYVLDPASYISQNTHKKNSKESIFGNIPQVHRPKKKLLIDDESKKNPTTKKLLNHHKPEERTKVRDDTNILRAINIGRKAKKEKQNPIEKSKFELVIKERNSNLQELRDFDDNINSYPPIGYQEPPHYPEIFVTKTVTMEHAISNNNHKYKDREDEHDYSSPFSKEYADNTAHRQGTKTYGDISIEKYNANRNKAIFNQNNKYTVIKTPIKPSTTKNNLRMMRTVNSDKIDTLSNNDNPNHKIPEEKEDENEYGSPFSKEYVENGPIRKYTKIDSNVSTKKIHDNKNPESNIKSNSPKIKVKGDQHPKFNQSMSMLNKPDNKYTAIMADIKITTANSTYRQDTKTGSDISITTIKNELRINSTVNTDKTDTLANNKQNDKSPLEDESYYGSPFSKEYDENGPKSQNTKIDDYNPKINIQDKQSPNLNRSKSILEQDITYSTTNTDITTTTAKNDIKIVSTVNIDKASEYNQSINNPHLNLDLKDSIIKDDHSSKEIVDSNKFPPLPSQNTSGSEITETTKVLPLKNFYDYDYPKHIGNETNIENPGIDRDYPDEVDYGDEESKNNTNHAIANPSPPVMVSEIVDVKTTPLVTTDSPSHFKDVTENSNKDKPKPDIDLRIGNNSNIKPKKHKDHHGKEKSNNRGDFIIDKKKGDEFSIIVTHLGKEKPEEIKQSDDLRVTPKELDQPEGKPIARKAFQKCMNKKAKKLCCKSCIRAYKNVCTRLKCTSRAKKALKKECKKSCEKTFKSSSSKYSDEDRDSSDSDSSDSDSS